VHSREGGFYRCSKQASEHYVEEYNRTYGLNYTILRYGSLYGPRADDSNGLLKIIKNAIETGKLIYHGHPDSMREYIHVEDAAEASLLALEKEFINKSVVLTGQEPMKVFDVLKMIGEMLGIPENSVKFIEGENIGHYVRTPYAYKPKLSKKFTPNIHIDFGQGLLDLISSIKDIK
jgi:UDP-glucose 4-epimerase